MVDALLLDPADGPLADERRMGRFNCLALLALAGRLGTNSGRLGLRR